MKLPNIPIAYIRERTNPNLFSLAALGLAVFFAGSFLEGERIRNREFREDIKAIKSKNRQILGRVAQINQTAARQDALIKEKITNAYEELAALQEEIQESKKRERWLNRKIASQKKANNENRQRMKQNSTLKEWFNRQKKE